MILARSCPWGQARPLHVPARAQGATECTVNQDRIARTLLLLTPGDERFVEFIIVLPRDHPGPFPVASLFLGLDLFLFLVQDLLLASPFLFLPKVPDSRPLAHILLMHGMKLDEVVRDLSKDINA